MSDERSFSNPYAQLPVCLPSSREKASQPPQVRNVSHQSYHLQHLLQVPPELSVRLLAALEQTLAECDSAYRHSPSADTSVYTGTAGVALLHLHVATTLHAEDQRKSREHLLQAQSLLTHCLSHVPSHSITFLCGAGGPLAIAAVVEAGLGNTDKAKVEEREGNETPFLSAPSSQSLLQQLKELYASNKSRFSQLPSELLYGHVGYLYCLLFVNAYLPGAVSQGLLQEVRSHCVRR